MPDSIESPSRPSGQTLGLALRIRCALRTRFEQPTLDRSTLECCAFAIAMLGFLLALPSLTLGLFPVDDPDQRRDILAHLSGTPQLHAWYDLYRIVDGDLTRALMERFATLRPWWSLPELHIRFFRPISVITLYVDYILWPNQLWAMHLQSALWYAMGVFLMVQLCTRFSADARLGLLGGLAYACDDAHLQPIAWLAHRNLLIAACFATLGLLLHHRAAQTAGWRTALASAACFLLALLSAESAIAIGAFLFAYALLLDPRSRWRRAASLLPFVSVALLWLALHRALGYGVYGSGFYLDPIGQPSAYLHEFSGRYSALVFEQFLPPALLQSWLPPIFVPVITWLALIPLAVFVIRSVDQNRELAFWSVAAVASLTPLLAAPPNDRVLEIAGIAWWMATAHLVAALLRHAQRHVGVRRIASGSLIAVLALVHLGFAPASLARGTYRFDTTAGVDPRERDAPVLGNAPTLEATDVVVINSPDAMLAGFFPAARRARGLRVPRRDLVLGVSLHEVEVTRVDAHAFDLYTPPGYLLDPFTNFWRGVLWPMQQGERIRIDGYDVQVRRLTPDGRPMRVRFRFDAPLDDPKLRFIFWNGEHLAIFCFGAVGERRIIPAEFDHSKQLPEELIR